MPLFVSLCSQGTSSHCICSMLHPLDESGVQTYRWESIEIVNTNVKQIVAKRMMESTIQINCNGCWNLNVGASILLAILHSLAALLADYRYLNCWPHYGLLIAHLLCLWQVCSRLHVCSTSLTAPWKSSSPTASPPLSWHTTPCSAYTLCGRCAKSLQM